MQKQRAALAVGGPAARFAHRHVTAPVMSSAVLWWKSQRSGPPSSEATGGDLL